MKKQKIGKRIRHIHIPHNPDVMQTVCEICGAEMDLRVVAETHTDTDGYDKEGPIPRAKQPRKLTVPKDRKRIISVTVKRMVDTNPDTSYLGEYSSRATSEFSIDREHSEDCASQEYNHHKALTTLEHALAHVEFLKDQMLEDCDCSARSWHGPEHDTACLVDNAEEDALDAALEDIRTAQDEVQDCDCSGGDKLSNEYRYFNPSFNYVKKDGSPNNLTPEEVRKYTRANYERMERLNAGDWCYIGIRAEAEIAVDPGAEIRDGLLTQTITSGGLWGTESDSNKEYLASVAAEELADLKVQLAALGFSKRAISQAFKPENIKEREA